MLISSKTGQPPRSCMKKQLKNILIVFLYFISILIRADGYAESPHIEWHSSLALFGHFHSVCDNMIYLFFTDMCYAICQFVIFVNDLKSAFEVFSFNLPTILLLSLQDKMVFHIFCGYFSAFASE